MKFAENINDIGNAFNSNPLKIEELDQFYYENTMEFRTGDKYISPIYDIFCECQQPKDRNAFLLLGHSGCGKSTELNKMSQELGKIGYHVVTVRCDTDLDLINPVYTDLLILMGEALLKIAKEVDCELKKDIKKDLISFWSTEMVENGFIKDTSESQVEIGVQAKTPFFLSAILDIHAGARANLRYNAEKREEYKTKITPRASDWLMMLNSIADEITALSCGRQPILIFEDLDKINPGKVKELFYNNAATLSGVTFPVIYTFPIAFSYDTGFASFSSYYIPKRLPIIKLENINGKIDENGIAVVIEIIKKRAKKELFADNVLKTLIKKTGGSLRDLFECINTSARRAIRRGSQIIEAEDIDTALKQTKANLTRVILSKHCDFLLKICQGNNRLPDDMDILLEMLRAGVILECNCVGWYNVHPLARDYLFELGILK
ncbi:MAG: hypothetical protein FWG43_04740 [Clostridiales bacterium]|nr:hypothetical protein [Clostridiales bacterium]